MEREVMLVMMAGAPGTGKTTLAKQFVEKLGQKKCLIIDPDGLEDKWKTYKRIDVSNPQAIRDLNGIAWSYMMDDTEKMFYNIYTNFRDGLLVFDDCRVYAKSNATDSLRNLLRRKRQMMADIICAAHGFSEIPPAFFAFTTHYALFRTMDNILKRKGELHPFEEFEKIKQRVDSKAGYNPYYREFFSQKSLLTPQKQ
jgi:hypothetical protein